MNTMEHKLKQIADRVRELRLISGMSISEMAARTGISEAEYEECEAGTRNLSVAFLYHCALSFGVDMGDILEGHSPKLRSYALTRRGEGQRIEEAQISFLRADAGILSGKCIAFLLSQYYDDPSG